MSKDHFIVIGNGPAGNQAAITLKETAPDARVTLISKGHEGCYRPRLLPYLIAGKVSEDGLYVSSLDSYEDKGIKLRKGQAVVDVHPRRKEVVLDHKEIIRFDGLIIAVGGKPRIPEPLLIFEDLMLTLKTLEDARLWMDKLSSANRVLMVGGDLTSLAVTKALLQLNKEVYFMLNENAFWPLSCTEDLLEEVAQRISKKGVKMIKGRKLKSIARLSEETIQVEVEHEVLEVGLIGAFFGLVPDIRFLAQSGLPKDRGLLVDETLSTGFENIYATGDCAQVYHPEIRDYWVSIGHSNAVALGRTAALNLLGGKVKAEVAKESLFDVDGIKVNNSWWMDF